MKTILVPTDFNSLATAALEFAVPLARAAGAGITVLYADTFEPPAEFTATQMHSLTSAIEASRSSAAAELDAYAHEHVPEDIRVETVVAEALPVPAIVQASREADLVVMGTHGRGPVSRLLLGSVARAVLLQTDTPVLTIKRSAAGRVVSRVLAYPGTEEKARPIAALLGVDVVAMNDDDVVAGPTDLVVVPDREHARIVRHSPTAVLAV